MEIAVCFKIVPDYEDVIPADWEDMEHLDFSFVKKIYGCYDEAALETALRLKDALIEAKKPVHCVAVTAGEGPAALFTGLYAAGFNEVVCISGEKTEFAPQKTAEKLSAYLKEKNPDLILTGSMTGPCDSGMVPACLAKNMGWEWLTNVTDLCFHIEKERLEVWNQEAQFEVHRTLDFPAVCTIGDGKHPYLRIFSLKDRLEARKKTVTEWPGRMEEVKQLEESSLKAFSQKKQENICCMLETDCVEETAKWLINMISGEVQQ